MFVKRKKPPPARLNLIHPVWFMLIEVRVTGDTIQPWIAGSTALVQMFVPRHRLEDALDLLDEYLPTQELIRIDTRQAHRHHPDDEYDVRPETYISEPLEEASHTNECRIGVFFVSQETAWPRENTQ